MLLLFSILCSQLPLSFSLVRDNPIAKGTLVIWSQFRKHFGLHGPSPLTPLFKNCNFMPSVTDSAFNVWCSKGIKNVKDLYSNNVFSSFAELSYKYQLPNSHIFCFFQARDFVKKQFPHSPNQPPETLLDTLLNMDPQRKKCTSVLYNMLDKSISKSIS